MSKISKSIDLQGMHWITDFERNTQCLARYKILIKTNYSRELEDGGKVDGSKTHWLVHPIGMPSWSFEEQSEQQTESQLIWSLEVKDCRGH